MTEWKEYWIWAMFNGLALAIALTHGIDITETGIAQIVLEGFKGIFPEILYFLLYLGLFLLGIASTYAQVKSLSEEDNSLIILCSSWFLSLFLLFLGIELKIEFIEQVGVIPLLIGVFMLWWFIKEDSK